jgi:hypothetical protein
MKVVLPSGFGKEILIERTKFFASLTLKLNEKNCTVGDIMESQTQMTDKTISSLWQTKYGKTFGST